MVFRIESEKWLHDNQLDEYISLTSSWIPVVALSLYMIAFGIGTGTVPWILLGELCPAKVGSQISGTEHIAAESRNLFFFFQISAVTSGIATFMAYLSLFAMIQTYSSLVEWLSLPIAYLVYGGVCLIMAIVTRIFLPETRGKTREEISDFFRDKKLVTPL